MVFYHFIEDALEQLVHQATVESLLLRRSSQALQLLLLAHRIDRFETMLCLQLTHALGHLEATRQRDQNFLIDAVDAITAGQIKGLIVLGHISSEQAGMAEFARRLTTIVPEVPVHFIPTTDPFWPVR